jgi:protein TonB
MFTQLVESAPRPRGLQGVPGPTISFAVHALLVFAAIVVTRNSGLPAPDPSPREIYLPLPDDPDHPREPTVELPGRFTIPDAPTFVPPDIPPVDSTQVWDSSVISRTRVFDPNSVLESQAPPVDPGVAINESLVDERPEQISMFSPAYPDLLRQAGIEGTVIVEVIIDTTGHAEPASLRIVRSTQRAFESSAREAVLKSLYRPGRVRGQAVRVLVQVPITFSIRR